MRADRILTGLIVVSVLLALLTAAHPNWLDGRRPRSDPGSQLQMVIPAGDEIHVRLRRIARKSVAIQRLYAGELTLFETAALFHRLNTTPAEIQDQSLRQWPGADDGERLCRQVLHWAETRWPDSCSPTHLKDRLDRLEQELQAHITAHGGVQLPRHVPEE